MISRDCQNGKLSFTSFTWYTSSQVLFCKIVFTFTNTVVQVLNFKKVILKYFSHAYAYVCMQMPMHVCAYVSDGTKLLRCLGKEQRC